MKKTYFFLLLSFITFSTYSQVGINTTTPEPSSVLDISSTNKGLLIPRIALTGENDYTTIDHPAESLMIYNTTTAGSLVPGFYFWKGSTWSALAETTSGSGGGEDSWSLTGNNISGDKFIGTTNYSALKFKVNNNQFALFNPHGGMAFGFGASANNENSIAIGTNANASNSNQSTAVGPSTLASGYQSAAFGYNAKAITSNSTLALGSNSTASSFQATAIGVNSKASSNNNALAVGTNSEATGENSSALGTSSKATGQYAVAFGTNSLATGANSSALGDNSNASGQNATAVGYGAVADHANTLILGNNSPASNWDGTKVGIGTSNPNAKLDVNGTYKLGINGTVHKGVTSFSAGSNLGNIGGGGGNVITINIPFNARPSSTSATIVVTPDNGMPDDLVIAWSKLQNNTTLRIKIFNTSGSQYWNPYTTFHVTITEF